MRFTCAALAFASVMLSGWTRVDGQAPKTQLHPEPRTSFDGPSIRFDFPGMFIGTAEYDEGPTGVTVFYFPNRVNGAVDIRGGSPGTVNTDALRMGYGDRDMSAVVLSGGSWHGLAAVTGVADEIRRQKVDSGKAPQIEGVVGAIINDLGFGTGRRRLTSVTPDDRLGRAALRAARPGRFFLGARGGGRFAMTGVLFGTRETSGQGGAFRQIGPTKVAVFTVVNAAGIVVDRTGQIVRCRAMHWGEKCGGIHERLGRRVDSLGRVAFQSPSNMEQPKSSGPSDNTTITLVVTNQKLEWWALQRLAAQVQTSMARAIQPFATVSDGDVLYAVTTDEVENARLSPGELGIIASELAWDAVLSSVPAGDPPVSTKRVSVDAATLDAAVGEYELGPGARVTILRSADGIVARSGDAGMYIAANSPVPLVPIGKNDFLVEGFRRDVIRFERNAAGNVTGFTINPGNWPVRGRRVATR